MALTTIEQPSPLARYNNQKEKAHVPPPEVAVTPCEPPSGPYYFEDGLRRVAPYHFTYNTWCKQRWRGREILEVFANEFRDRSVEYYVGDYKQKEAMLAGKIHINGKPVPSPSHVVNNGDLISHTIHRHEPPVSAEPIGIVHESNDMLIINKPAGIPVHPAGRYRYNSVIEILRSEHGLGFDPLPCNRLDRLTSGIMFIAKHPVAAEKMTQQLTLREVKKEYVCRVVGEFPVEEVACDQPILQISPKLGLNRVRANGKTARTVFQRIAYYPQKSDTEPTVDLANISGHRSSSKGYSIVLARPLTGRTHQIRVHLQYLGHPIGNDPIYSNQRVFGPDLGAFSSSPTSDESIMERLSRMGKTEAAEAVAWHDEMVDQYNKKRAEKLSGLTCELCGTELYTDPDPRELGIWLHARRYESKDGEWGYETGLPAWALAPEERKEMVTDGGEVVGGETVVKEARVVGDLEKALEATTLEGKEEVA